MGCRRVCKVLVLNRRPVAPEEVPDTEAGGSARYSGNTCSRLGILSGSGLARTPALASSATPNPERMTTSYWGRAADALILATISDVRPVRSATTFAPVATSNGFMILRTAAWPVLSAQVRTRICLPAKWLFCARAELGCRAEPPAVSAATAPPSEDLATIEIPLAAISGGHELPLFFVASGPVGAALGSDCACAGSSLVRSTTTVLALLGVTRSAPDFP